MSRQTEQFMSSEIFEEMLLSCCFCGIVAILRIFYRLKLYSWMNWTIPRIPRTAENNWNPVKIKIEVSPVFVK